MALNSSKTFLGVFLAAVVLALLGYCFWPDRKEPIARTQQVQREYPSSPKPTKRAEIPNKVTIQPKAKSVEIEDDMSPADKKLCTDIQTALDSEDKAALRVLVKEALQSENPEVRKAMVEALGWFGKGVIGDLAAFLVDKDAGVRETAGNRWQMAVSEIDDESSKSVLVEETLKTVADENLIDMIASEYNGMDEKLAIESIIRVVIAGNAAGVKAAKEAYEFVTGEEWVSTAEARAWLQENYTPPEAD